MLNKVSLLRPALFAAAGAMTLAIGAPVLAYGGDNPDSNSASASSQGSAPRVAKRNAPTKYCFLLETTGSRLTKKVCKTKAEWEAEGQEIEIK